MPRVDLVTRALLQGTPFAHERGQGSKGWCGVLCSPFCAGHRGQGSKGGGAYLSRVALAPPLTRRGGVARTPRAEGGGTRPHIEQGAGGTPQSSPCFATPVEGGGCVRTLFLHPLLVAPPRLLARGWEARTVRVEERSACAHALSTHTEGGGREKGGGR